MPILSCSMCNLAPQPGKKQGPPILGAWSISHWTTQEVPLLKKKKKQKIHHEFHSSATSRNGILPVTSWTWKTSWRLRWEQPQPMPWLQSCWTLSRERTSQSVPQLLTQGGCEIINPCCFQPLCFCGDFLWSNRKPTQMPMRAWHSAGVLEQRNREGEQREVCMFIHTIKGKYRIQWDQWRSLSFCCGKVENKQAAPQLFQTWK